MFQSKLTQQDWNLLSELVDEDYTEEVVQTEIDIICQILGIKHKIRSSGFSFSHIIDEYTQCIHISEPNFQSSICGEKINGVFSNKFSFEKILILSAFLNNKGVNICGRCMQVLYGENY